MKLRANSALPAPEKRISAIAVQIAAAMNSAEISAQFVKRPKARFVGVVRKRAPLEKEFSERRLPQYSEGSIGLGVPLSALISRRSGGIRGTGIHLLHHQPSIYSPLLTPHPRRPLFATLRPFEVQYSADICTSAQNSVRLDQLGPDLRYHPGARSAA